MLFYACELGLGLDIGDSFRAVAGLGLGYFARIFIPIEQLVRYLIVCMRCVCGGGVYATVCVCSRQAWDISLASLSPSSSW